MRFGLRRLGTATSVALAGLALGACYFTTDFAGLSDGSVAPSEAGADAMPASVDAGGDAGGGGDAGDAAVGIDAGYPCLPGDFCDGFERGMVQGPWDRESTDTGSTLAITGHAHTGASALRLVLGTPEGTDGYVAHQASSPKTIIAKCSFFQSAVPSRAVNIMNVVFQFAEMRFDQVFFIFGSDGSVVFAEQELKNGAQTFFDSTDGIDVVLGRWVDLRLEVDVSTTPAGILAVYGDKVLLSGVLARAYAPTDTGVLLGSPFSSAGAPATFDFDDVVIHVTQ